MIDPRIRHFYKTFGCTPFLVPAWGADEYAVIQRALRGQESPPHVRDDLEEMLRQSLGFNHVVLTATGRQAIEVALSHLAKPPGEVIMPTFACGSMANAITAAGYVPVFADINKDLTLSCRSTIENLTSKTVAVIVAHLSGKPAEDLEELVELCRTRGLVLIDDAAQAMGISHRGRQLGTFGDYGVLSFGLGKPTFSLGGGCLILKSHSEKLACQGLMDGNVPSDRGYLRTSAALVRFVSEYCWREQTLPVFLAARAFRKYLHLHPQAPRSGQISALEAELQTIQLARLPQILKSFRDNARQIIARLSNVLAAPQEGPETGYTKCLVQTQAHKGTTLSTYLLKQGIEIEWSYRPLDSFGAFAQYRRRDNSYAESIWRHLLAVPVHPNLETHDIDRIALALEQFQ